MLAVEGLRTWPRTLGHGGGKRTARHGARSVGTKRWRPIQTTSWRPTGVLSKKTQSGTPIINLTNTWS